jgi:hypothetical protein
VLLGDAAHQNQACNRQCKNYAYLRGSRLDVSRDARLTVILLASAAHQAQHHHEQVYEVEVER